MLFCHVFFFTNCKKNELENKISIHQNEVEIYQNTEEINGFKPWGVWNKTITPYFEEDIRIRTVDKNDYYEIALSGLFLTKQGKELFNEIIDNFSIVSIQGEYTRIEKYEVIDDGFIFSLVGEGFKHTSDGTKFQDNTRVHVKMHFINEDECYFEYLSLEDENGFSLSYFPEENVNYKRLSADKGNVRPEVFQSQAEPAVTISP